MPQRQKQTYEDYSSPETVDSSPACGVHGPSPNSSFGSPAQGDKAAEESEHGRGAGACAGDTDGDTGTDEEAPQVLRAVELVRACAYGQRLDGGPGDWIELEITPPQYRKFLEILELDRRTSAYFRDKVRHDYDPRRCVLVLRMPSSVHDVFQGFLLSKITGWIERVQDRHTPRIAEDIIQQITPALTTDFSIKLHSADAAEAEKEKVTHSPDGQYHYIGYRYPVAVVEVGFSQTGKDLEALAKHYYEETAGHIKTVLTIDLAYITKAQRRLERRRMGRRRARSYVGQENSGTTKQASFSLYRGPKRVTYNQLFRNKAGGLVQSEGITLYISDLIPDVVLTRLSEDPQQAESSDDHALDLSGSEYAFHITVQELFNMLTRSEVVQGDRDKTHTPSPTPQAQPQKRRVEWELEQEEEDDDVQYEEEHDEKSPSRRRSALTSSKRRRLSHDRGFASSSKPSTSVSLRTRSQSRSSC